MKAYQIYECEKCGKTSKKREDIELCEGLHKGLTTIDEIKEYNKLDDNVRYTSAMVSIASNEDTRSKRDKAIDTILQFEKDHHMTVD